jgi:hypothetical protein
MAGLLPESKRDEVARDAARLLRDGRATDVKSAIRSALRGAEGADEVSVARVREHARGLALEAMGSSGYSEHVAAILSRAEETMTLLAAQLAGRSGEAPVALIGRAARGLIDADPCCRIRVETDRSIGDIAAVLVEAGLPEPEFSTVETRFGRLGRLTFDDDGLETKVVRLPPGMNVPLDADFRSSATIPALDLEAVRRLVVLVRPQHAE